MASKSDARGLVRLILLAAAAALLGGCAANSREAPPLSAPLLVAPQTDAQPVHAWLGNEPESQIALYRWTPEADAPVEAIIVAAHGFGDHARSTFAEAAMDWAAQGIATYAHDQRGFGANPSRANWPGESALITDLGLAAQAARADYPDKPLILLGHSMGGGVVVAALGEGAAEADAAILLAPALWGGPHLNPLYRAAAWLASTTVPDKRWTGEGVVRIQASDNREALLALARDPLYLRHPSSREFMGLVRLMDRAWEAAPDVRAPVLLIYGAHDEVLPLEPLRAGFERLGARDKRFETAPEGWHLLLRDLNSAAVRDRVAAYTLQIAGLLREDRLEIEGDRQIGADGGRAEINAEAGAVNQPLY